MGAHRRAVQISKLLDWNAVFADYQSKRCYSLRYYYHRYFKDFCASCGITDHLLGEACFYRHINPIVAQKAQQSSCDEPTAEQEIIEPVALDQDPSLQESEPKNSEPKQVAIFDLEQLIASATTTSIKATAPSPSRHPSGLDLNAPNSKLCIEWAGMSFSYQCLDPGRSLALLLYRLKELAEAQHHAH